MSDSRLVRAEMTREDGSRLILTGEAVQAWERANEGLAGYLYAHGMDPFKDVFDLPGVLEISADTQVAVRCEVCGERCTGQEGHPVTIQPC